MLKKIPKKVLKQSWTYTAKASGGLYEENEAVPVVIKECYIEIVRKLVRASNGDMSTIDGFIAFNGSKGIIKNSKATVNGSSYTIFDVFEPVNPFTGNVHHTELLLKEEL